MCGIARFRRKHKINQVEQSEEPDVPITMETYLQLKTKVESVTDALPPENDEIRLCDSMDHMHRTLVQIRDKVTSQWESNQTTYINFIDSYLLIL